MTGAPWQKYCYTLLYYRLEILRRAVFHLREKDPENYARHPTAKLFVSVIRALDDAAQDPTLPKFELGKPLGPEHTAWRRIKQLLPPRYRLFFRFSSQERQVIFVWLNDERTLRKAGASSDVYNVFKRMLEKGDVPSRLKELLTASIKIQNHPA